MTNPYHGHTILVLGNELASRITTDEGTPGDCGRLAQNASNKLGVAVCAYERLGTGKRTPWHIQRMIRKALGPDEYVETMADIGAEIRQRIHDETKRSHGIDRIVIVGKSAGATSGITLAHSNTVAADCAVFMDPAGMYDMGNTFNAVRGFMAYKRKVESTIPKPPKPPTEAANAEPVSTLRQLQKIDVPTVMDIPEFGMYCNVPRFSTDAFVKELNRDQYPQVQGYLRQGATHDWYNGSPEYAEAVRHGLIMLGRWGIDATGH